MLIIVAIFPESPTALLDWVTKVTAVTVDTVVMVHDDIATVPATTDLSCHEASTVILVIAESTFLSQKESPIFFEAIAWTVSSVEGFMVAPAAFLMPRIFEMMGGIQVVFIEFLLSNYIVFSHNRKS